MQSLKELETVINHFQKLSLITKKRAYLKLLIMIVEKMKRKDHLNDEGLIKIVAIKASMNLGLSEKLKLAKNPPHRGGSCQILTKSFLLKIILLKLAFPE